jgi:hypothetical protein
MSVFGDPLFHNRADIGDVIRQQGARVRSAVDGIADNRFDRMSDDEAVNEVVDKLKIDPLRVDFENAAKSVRETKMDYRDPFGGIARVDALEVSKSFPFEGDQELWTIGTGSWSSTMPRGDIIGGRLTVGMTVRTNEGETAKGHIDKTVEQIKEYIAQQTRQIDAFNATLPGQARPLVEERRKRRCTASDLLAKL